MKLEDIQQKCLEGKIGVPEAISEIDSSIGGIESVDFKEGIKFKISNGSQLFPLKFIVKKRERDRLYGLAVLAYDQAQFNGHSIPGGVHISRTASTKDHTEGIEKIRNKYAGG